MTEQQYQAPVHLNADEKEIEQRMIKVIAQMPEKVQSRFKVLKILSDKRSKLSDEFDKEIKEIEQKIASQKKPLYELRQKIVEGTVTEFGEYKNKFAESLAKAETVYAENLAKKEDKTEAEEEIKVVDVENLIGKTGIPDFWWRSIKNNQMIYELVKEKDEPILQNIRHIEAERHDAIPGDAASRKHLHVKFHFNDNEYFTEKALEIKVFYKPETEDEVERIEGSPISWADETKDPTKKKIKKKQKHKKTNETRTIVKTVEAESFFNVFTNRVAPEEGDLDEEEENELRDKIDMAMNLAEDVNDVLIPDALEYYLDLNDDMYGGEGCEDEDCDDDEHGKGDDSDEEDADDKKKSSKKASKGGDKKAEGAAAGDQKQECKQQ